VRGAGEAMDCGGRVGVDIERAGRGRSGAYKKSQCRVITRLNNELLELTTNSKSGLKKIAFRAQKIVFKYNSRHNKGNKNGHQEK